MGDMDIKAKTSRLGTWFSRDDWEERVISFNASWFTASMGSGICVQVLYNFPYNATWIKDIAYCLWVLAMLLFIFFTALGITRGIKHPDLTREILEDFYQTSYLGAIPITIDTIAVGFVLFYGELEGTIWFAYSLFWVSTFLSITVGGIIVWITTAVQEAPDLASVNGIWLLSFIPFIVTSAAGGTIIPHLTPEARGATLIVSFLLWSIGVSMCMVLTTIYFWRLVKVKLPVRDAIVSCFIAMGPTGMAAYSIQNLAVAFQSYLTSESFNLNRPMPPSTPYASSFNQPGVAYHLAVGTAIHWVGILIALFFISFATFWLLQSVLSVIWRVPKSFSVGHWSFVFPNAVYSNALSMISKDLDNTGLRGWAAAISTITLLLWLYCALGTFYKGVWCGELFFAPGLEGWNEKEALKQAARRRSEMLVERPDGVAFGGELATNGDRANSSAHTTGLVANAGDSELLDEGTFAREHRPDGTYAVVKGRRRKARGAENV